MQRTCYRLYVSYLVESSIESPSCPSYWMGSGCYDIDIYNVIHVRCYVTADSPEEARELARAYADRHIDYGAISEGKVWRCELDEPDDCDANEVREWESKWEGGDPEDNENWTTDDGILSMMCEGDCIAPFEKDDEEFRVWWEEFKKEKQAEREAMREAV